MAFVPEPGELESAVALPASDGSSGICTLRTGRFPVPSWAELVLEGGAKLSDIDDKETFLFAWVWLRAGIVGGDVVKGTRVALGTSIDWA